MVSVFVGYAFVLLASGVFVAALAMYAWDRRDRVGAKPLSVLLIGQAVWCGCAAAAVLSRETWWALFWSRAWYVGIVVTVAGLFVFALEYTGHEKWLGWRTYALLAVEPAILLTVAAVAPEMLYTVEGRSTAEMLGWVVVSGDVFWAHVAYSYLLVTVSSVLIVRFALSSGELYRKQVYGLLAAIAVPWAGNALYLFGDVGVDTTPMTFAATGAALSWAVLRAGFLDISPIAHQKVVESLNSAVFVIDGEGRLTEVNDAGRQLLGGDGVVNEPVADAFAEWPALRDTAVLEVSSETRTEIARDDRYFDVHVTPLYDDRDHRIGRLVLVHEMTEQKTRERQLEHRNQQLDRFASVVSHDLRNPLNVADGSLELARETGSPQHFDRLERALGRMDQLIGEMLTLARGGSVTDEATVSLAAVAQKAWGHVETRDATLRVDTDRAVVGSEEQLLQLLENAFRNSVEHGGDGVTMTITADDDGFYVADDGEGIPEAERESVFEHGFTTSEEGTGLGLAIIEHVSESHGWDATITESDAGGARLSITGVETKTDGAANAAVDERSRN
ncbi:histidine kinase N-terminal 7TM domain-containing protein [Haloarcula nitratireducens]|uniref:histidine kinase n=1 Tax=Haloarcula nitratireducens TaxID=2487749 RepID=A0AAW4P8H4_9EURY|nr:histidine kinase N-terminal 7TM domain-containing protein [Halomicroarcula nitratireducens]MBX0294209.1 PAS domain-containing protein [Halomicroarcula nitratireducens]